MRSALLSLLLAVFFLMTISTQIVTAENQKSICVPSEESIKVIEKMTIKRRFDPIEINGEYLDQFLGKPFKNMRLFAYKEGLLRVIPYQFDERRNDLTYILPEGSAGDSRDINGILEPWDELVFMASDVGDRFQPADAEKNATFFEEITIIDPIDRGQGWIYLAYYQDISKAPHSKFKPKVWLGDNPDAFVMHGSSYVIGGLVNEIGDKVYKTAINNRLSIPEEAGGKDINIFDRMKTRIWTSLFFGLIKFSLNENNVIGELDQYKEGSVRAFGRNWLQIALPTKIANIKSPKIFLDIFCFDTMILIPMTIHVPFNAKIVGVKAGLSYGYDLNEDAFGMKFYNSENLEGFVIDGRMDEAEHAMNHDLDEWRCITGPQGTMVTSSVWDKGYLDMAKISIEYIDDLNQKVEPEDLAGQIGYHYNQSMTELSKPGYYDALLCWYFPPNFYDPNRFKIEMIEEYVAIRTKPVKIKAGERRFKNPGGWPELLIPKNKSK